MSYRAYPDPSPLLIGYDPFYDLPEDHLARFIEAVVHEAIVAVPKDERRGQPAFDPRLCLKVLLYGYATGSRSSRQLEKMCRESLPFLYLTRGDTPSYRTLCSVRVNDADLLEQLWLSLFLVAKEAGLKRLGRIVVDSTKIRADASDESVITADEMEPLRKQIQEILREAEQADQVEGSEGYSGETRIDQPAASDQMRDIIRRVRKQIGRSKKAQAVVHGGNLPTGAQASEQTAEELPSPVPDAGHPESAQDFRVTQKMYDRLKIILKGLTNAIKAGEKYISTTDLDARMMGEGRHKRIMMCHSYEVAVDDGLLVAAGVSQSPNDQCRLIGLVDQARKNEPNGVEAVSADSGYYSGNRVMELINHGVDVCIPTSSTACDIRRGLTVGTTAACKKGKVHLAYIEDQDHYTCPEDNILTFRQQRLENGVETKVYRAKQLCDKCKLASLCLIQKNAKRRTLKVAVEDNALRRQQERFMEKEHVDRYHRRADAVETVFGFVRSALGFNRWAVRGDVRVTSEAAWISTAYQFRKVYKAMRPA